MPLWIEKIVDFFINNVISIIALVVSFLAYFTNIPKLKIKHIETIYDEIYENEDCYFPNFILKISNTRNMPIGIDSISMINVKPQTIRNVNIVIPPFCSIVLYVGKKCVETQLKDFFKSQIENINIFDKNLGLKSGLSKKIIDNVYPIVDSFYLPKIYTIQKPKKLKIQIDTTFKKYRITIPFNTKKNIDLLKYMNQFIKNQKIKRKQIKDQKKFPSEI